MSNKAVKITGKLISPNADYRYGSTVKAELYINVLHDISFHSFKVIVKWGVRGVNHYHSHSAYEEVVLNTGNWKKGESHRINFEFIPRGQISYYGTHIQIVWFIETDIDLTSESTYALRKLYAKDLSLKKAWNPEIEYDRELKFKVIPKSYAYIVKDTKFEEKTSFNKLMFLIPAFLIGITAAFNFPGWSVITVLLSFAFIVYGYYRMRGLGKLEKLSIEVENLDDKFKTVKLNIANNHDKLSYVNVYFKAEENVIDRSGSSSTTLVKTLRTGKKYRYKKIEANNTFTIPIEAKKIPGSFYQDDSRIIWSICFDFAFKKGATRSLHKDVHVKLNPYYLGDVV